MKKIVITCIIVLCTLAIAVAGTMAFFSVSEKATNTITSGKLTMILHDETTGGEPFPEGGIHGILPSYVVDKVVYIENNCPNSEYVRIYLEKFIQAEDGSEAELNFDNITLDINEAMWTQGDDGWYYYNVVLYPGESTEPLFTKVSFDGSLGNEYANCSLQIIVHAQAVQSEHNGDSSLLADGWPAPDFEIGE